MATATWRAGGLSNLDYLLALNHFAGRTRGDRSFHAVVPWVTDFLHDPAGSFASASWRDLTKSKWRLAKGDEQLDFTYARSEPPHHVSDDCLCELAVCIYKARRLPLPVLRRTVRAVFVANEYPGTMERLFEWSPDEAVPEFYDDAEIFRSSHPGGLMSDLAVPGWASGPEDFVKRHRTALESPEVTAGLPAGVIHRPRRPFTPSTFKSRLILSRASIFFESLITSPTTTRFFFVFLLFRKHVFLSSPIKPRLK